MSSRNKTILALTSLFFLSLWAIFPFFASGLPNTHDGQTHVMRLASFHQALVEGQFPPRWAGNLAYGFGSPILSYYFPFPYIVGDLFHLLGFSFQDSIKVVFVLGYLLSGLTMFLFLNKATSYLSAFLGSVIYLFAPYRFLDLYVRGEVGEALVFVFPPLILWLLWDIKRMNWVKISLAGLFIGMMFLSHQTMGGVFAGLMFLILATRSKLRYFILSCVFGVLLASYNLFPLFFERGFTNINSLLEMNFRNQFPGLNSLFYSPWHWGPASPGNPGISMSFQLGFAQWMSVAALLLVLLSKLFKEKKKRISGLIFPVLVLSLFSVLLFLITSYSKFLWQDIFFLKSILYPWRLLGVEVFLSAIAISLAVFLIKQKWLKILLVIFLTFLSLYGNRNHNQVVGRASHNDEFYLAYPGTSDMWGEYLPKGAKVPATLEEEKVNGEVRVESLQTKSNYVIFKAIAPKEETVSINIFSFPGWQVFIDNRKTVLNSSRLLEFYLPKGEHLVEARLSETPIRFWSNILSLATFVLIMLMMIRGYFLKRR